MSTMSLISHSRLSTPAAIAGERQSMLWTLGEVIEHEVQRNT